MFIDTHCHIHEDDFSLDVDEVIERAKSAGVDKLICVGTTADDSEVAAGFVSSRGNAWFSIGHHPHEADNFSDKDKLTMQGLIKHKKLVAVGECGFDYWYLNASKRAQEDCLRFQLELGLEHNLPFIFHVRGSKENPHDAFDDLWRVLESYPDIHGVIHSFTANTAILNQVLQRGLCVGINGIMTFTKDQSQLAALDGIPLEKMVLETDAPFLTPHPFRGTVNEPKHLVEVARFIAQRKEVTLEVLGDTTSKTACELFNI